MQLNFTRRVLMLGVALTFGLLVFAGSAAAQDTKNPPGKQPPMTPPVMMEQTTTISGRVTVATDGSITVVDDQKNEHSIGVTADTKVTKAGKAATLTDIKAGDSVIVVANKGEGAALVAVSVSAT